MKRVIVTGATGFIGSHLLAQLRARKFDVHTIGRSRPADDAIIHHQADLLRPEEIRDAVDAARASHLVHLSWYAEPGQYWRSPVNLDWVGASLRLARLFTDAGGRRMVVAGSCAEYAWGAPRFVEGETPCAPATFYGTCKDALRRILESYGEVAPLSIGWGRVFFLYGPGEKQGRLISDAIRSLLRGAALSASHGWQRRDFMHVEDVAAAFAALADSDVQGAVNIGSGTAVSVRAVLDEIARQTGGAHLIDFGARQLAATEPETIEASTARLREEVGFRPRYDLGQGITQTIAWWRTMSSIMPAR